MKLRELFLIATICSVQAVQASAQAQLRNICVVIDFEGDVHVSAPGARGRPAQVGLGLGRNATLQTGIGGGATLRCDGQLRVVVGAETELTVLQILDRAPRTFRLRMMRGIGGFFFGNGDTEGEVEVRTPSAVAAVRSTEWAIQVAEGASAVFAREGEVFVAGETGVARLGPGDGVDVSADGSVGAVVQWGRPRIDLFSELLGPDW